MQRIPYGRQTISEADVSAVVDVLQSDWLTQGPAVERFEGAMAQYCNAAHAVAACNATASLHLACKALELGAGDYLWTTPNTFVASANCALYCGADVDFVDIDAKTYNMCPDALADKLRHAEQNGRLPKIVIPVHFGGQPCEMQTIADLAKKYRFGVIEDASHAVGALYNGEKIGSCSFSDITVFSFHAVKVMTTGEGGMLLTNSAELSRKLKMLSSHGITRDPSLMSCGCEGGWFYEQLDLGANYRMTDFQAALGKSQLSRLDEFVERRHCLAHQYNENLRDLPLQRPWQSPNTRSAWHLYVIQLALHELRKTRREVFDELRSAGIGVNVHYIPVHLQPYYRRKGFQRGDFPRAERYYEAAITLPLHFGLTDSQQEYVIQTLKNVLQ